MVLQALASSLARLPLFRSAAEAVAELLEMCADDSAARRHGTRPLLRVLLTLAGSHHMVADGLAAAGTAVFARAARLVAPPRRAAQWRERLLLAATMTITVTAPAVINLICHH